ncbi:MAG: homoserine O-succinyltransferase [Alphaproteobacteria bacterium]|nr:homoserine O-succinyltransferase [Alphaproteobacteria bacterium]
MPLIISDNLPALQTLEQERISFIPASRAAKQDIRPISIAILNLMPDKIATETQLARLIGNTPLQVSVSLLVPGTHSVKTAEPAHITAHYRTWQQARDTNERYDALIITGAPLGHLPFEEVGYWKEFTEILAWSQSHVFTTLTMCWAAMAALHHFHGIRRYPLPAKLFGIYNHYACAAQNDLLRGFNDEFYIPVSRHTEVKRQDILDAGLESLIDSDAAGIALIREQKRRMLYMINHWEYDTQTLAHEYRRDRNAGKPIALPHDYFTGNDPEAGIKNRWRSSGHLFFANWVNYIYQNTPYDLGQLAADERPTLAQFAGAQRAG